AGRHDDIGDDVHFHGFRGPHVDFQDHRLLPLVARIDGVRDIGVVHILHPGIQIYDGIRSHAGQVHKGGEPFVHRQVVNGILNVTNPVDFGAHIGHPGYLLVEDTLDDDFIRQRGGGQVPHLCGHVHDLAHFHRESDHGTQGDLGGVFAYHMLYFETPPAVPQTVDGLFLVFHLVVVLVLVVIIVVILVVPLSFLVIIIASIHKG